VVTFTKEWIIVRKACEDPVPLSIPTQLVASRLKSWGVLAGRCRRSVDVLRQPPSDSLPSVKRGDDLHSLSLASSSPLWCGTPQPGFNLQPVLGEPSSWLQISGRPRGGPRLNFWLTDYKQGGSYASLRLPSFLSPKGLSVVRPSSA